MECVIDGKMMKQPPSTCLRSDVGNLQKNREFEVAIAESKECDVEVTLDDVPKIVSNGFFELNYSLYIASQDKSSVTYYQENGDLNPESKENRQKKEQKKNNKVKNKEDKLDVQKDDSTTKEKKDNKNKNTQMGNKENDTKEIEKEVEDKEKIPEMVPEMVENSGSDSDRFDIYPNVEEVIEIYNQDDSSDVYNKVDDIYKMEQVSEYDLYPKYRDDDSYSNLEFTNISFRGELKKDLPKLEEVINLYSKSSSFNTIKDNSSREDLSSCSSAASSAKEDSVSVKENDDLEEYFMEAKLSYEKLLLGNTSLYTPKDPKKEANTYDLTFSNSLEVESSLKTNKTMELDKSKEPRVDNTTDTSRENKENKNEIDSNYIKYMSFIYGDGTKLQQYSDILTPDYKKIEENKNKNTQMGNKENEKKKEKEKQKKQKKQKKDKNNKKDTPRSTTSSTSSASDEDYEGGEDPKKRGDGPDGTSGGNKDKNNKEEMENKKEQRKTNNKNEKEINKKLKKKEVEDKDENQMPGSYTEDDEVTLPEEAGVLDLDKLVLDEFMQNYRENAESDRDWDDKNRDARRMNLRSSRGSTSSGSSDSNLFNSINNYMNDYMKDKDKENINNRRRTQNNYERDNLLTKRVESKIDADTVIPTILGVDSSRILRSRYKNKNRTSNMIRERDKDNKNKAKESQDSLGNVDQETFRLEEDGFLEFLRKNVHLYDSKEFANDYKTKCFLENFCMNYNPVTIINHIRTIDVDDRRSVLLNNENKIKENKNKKYNRKRKYNKRNKGKKMKEMNKIGDKDVYILNNSNIYNMLVKYMNSVKQLAVNGSNEGKSKFSSDSVDNYFGSFKINGNNKEDSTTDTSRDNKEKERKEIEKEVEDKKDEKENKNVKKDGFKEIMSSSRILRSSRINASSSKVNNKSVNKNNKKNTKKNKKEQKKTNKENETNNDNNETNKTMELDKSKEKTKNKEEEEGNKFKTPVNLDMINNFKDLVISNEDLLLMKESVGREKEDSRLYDRGYNDKYNKENRVYNKEKETEEKNKRDEDNREKENRYNNYKDSRNNLEDMNDSVDLRDLVVFSNHMYNLSRSVSSSGSDRLGSSGNRNGLLSSISGSSNKGGSLSLNSSAMSIKDLIGSDQDYESNINNTKCNYMNNNRNNTKYKLRSLDNKNYKEINTNYDKENNKENEKESRYNKNKTTPMGNKDNNKELRNRSNYNRNNSGYSSSYSKGRDSSYDSRVGNKGLVLTEQLLREKELLEKEALMEEYFKDMDDTTNTTSSIDSNCFSGSMMPSVSPSVSKEEKLLRNQLLEKDDYKDILLGNFNAFYSQPSPVNKEDLGGELRPEDLNPVSESEHTHSQPDPVIEAIFDPDRQKILLEKERDEIRRKEQKKVNNNLFERKYKNTESVVRKTYNDNNGIRSPFLLAGRVGNNISRSNTKDKLRTLDNKNYNKEYNKENETKNKINGEMELKYREGIKIQNTKENEYRVKRRRIEDEEFMNISTPKNKKMDADSSCLELIRSNSDKLVKTINYTLNKRTKSRTSNMIRERDKDNKRNILSNPNSQTSPVNQSKDDMSLLNGYKRKTVCDNWISEMWNDNVNVITCKKMRLGSGSFSTVSLAILRIIRPYSPSALNNALVNGNNKIKINNTGERDNKEENKESDTKEIEDKSENKREEDDGSVSSQADTDVTMTQSRSDKVDDEDSKKVLYECAIKNISDDYGEISRYQYIREKEMMLHYNQNVLKPISYRILYSPNNNKIYQLLLPRAKGDLLTMLSRLIVYRTNEVYNLLSAMSNCTKKFSRYPDSDFVVDVAYHEERPRRDDTTDTSRDNKENETDISRDKKEYTTNEEDKKENNTNSNNNKEKEVENKKENENKEDKKNEENKERSRLYGLFEVEIKYLLIQILSGLSFIHMCFQGNILRHTDIKLTNILVFCEEEDRYVPLKWHLNLADFGCSMLIKPNQYFKQIHHLYSKLNNLSKGGGSFGNANYSYLFKDKNNKENENSWEKYVKEWYDQLNRHLLSYNIGTLRYNSPESLLYDQYLNKRANHNNQLLNVLYKDILEAAKELERFKQNNKEEKENKENKINGEKNEKYNKDNRVYNTTDTSGDNKENKNEIDNREKEMTLDGIKYTRVDSKSDMWSMGIIVSELLKYSMKDGEFVVSEVASGNLDLFPGYLSSLVDQNSGKRGYKFVRNEKENKFVDRSKEIKSKLYSNLGNGIFYNKIRNHLVSRRKNRANYLNKYGNDMNEEFNDSSFKKKEVVDKENKLLSLCINDVCNNKFEVRKKKLMELYRNNEVDGVDEQLVNLMTNLLSYEPEERLLSVEALGHPCFNDNEYIFNLVDENNKQYLKKVFRLYNLNNTNALSNSYDSNNSDNSNRDFGNMNYNNNQNNTSNNNNNKENNNKNNNNNREENEYGFKPNVSSSQADLESEDVVDGDLDSYSWYKGPLYYYLYKYDELENSNNSTSDTNNSDIMELDNSNSSNNTNSNEDDNKDSELVGDKEKEDNTEELEKEDTNNNEENKEEEGSEDNSNNNNEDNKDKHSEEEADVDNMEEPKVNNMEEENEIIVISDYSNKEYPGSPITQSNDLANSTSIVSTSTLESRNLLSISNFSENISEHLANQDNRGKLFDSRSSIDTNKDTYNNENKENKEEMKVDKHSEEENNTNEENENKEDKKNEENKDVDDELSTSNPSCFYRLDSVNNFQGLLDFRNEMNNLNTPGKPRIDPNLVIMTNSFSPLDPSSSVFISGCYTDSVITTSTKFDVSSRDYYKLGLSTSYLSEFPSEKHFGVDNTKNELSFSSFDRNNENINTNNTNNNDNKDNENKTMELDKSKENVNEEEKEIIKENTDSNKENKVEDNNTFVNNDTTTNNEEEERDKEMKEEPKVDIMEELEKEDTNNNEEKEEEMKVDKEESDNNSNNNMDDNNKEVENEEKENEDVNKMDLDNTDTPKNLATVLKKVKKSKLDIYRLEYKILMKRQDELYDGNTVIFKLLEDIKCKYSLDYQQLTSTYTSHLLARELLKFKQSPLE